MSEQTPRTDAATKPNFESVGVTVWDYEELRQSMLDLERSAQAQIAALEAKIIALMLEYCPDEMTPEQIAKWEAYPKVAPEVFQDER